MNNKWDINWWFQKVELTRFTVYVIRPMVTLVMVLTIIKGCQDNKEKAPGEIMTTGNIGVHYTKDTVFVYLYDSTASAQVNNSERFIKFKSLPPDGN